MGHLWDPCPPIVYTYSIVKINDYYHIGFLEQNSSSRLVLLEFENLLPITLQKPALYRLWNCGGLMIQ